MHIPIPWTDGVGETVPLGGREASKGEEDGDALLATTMAFDVNGVTGRGVARDVAFARWDATEEADSLDFTDDDC